MAEVPCYQLSADELLNLANTLYGMADSARMAAWMRVRGES